MFFIVGSQRTGTTLLTLMLNSCDNIQVVDEPVSYGALKSPDEDIPGYKIPMWTYTHNMLSKKFGNKIKFIFMFRDIRSIVSSMINLEVAPNLNWVSRNARPESEDAIHVIENSSTRHFLKSVLKNLDSDIELGTFSAFLKSYFYHEYINNNRITLTVQYEELIKNPKQISMNILNFLDYEWDEKVLNHHKIQSGKRIGETISEKPIFSDSLYKWKQTLNEVKQTKILDTCKYLISAVQHIEPLSFDIKKQLIYLND